MAAVLHVGTPCGALPTVSAGGGDCAAYCTDTRGGPLAHILLNVRAAFPPQHARSPHLQVPVPEQVQHLALALLPLLLRSTAQ